MNDLSTLAGLLGSAPCALSPEHCQAYLSQADLDAQLIASDDRAEVKRGERFVVARGVAIVPVRGILTPNSHMRERYLGWTTYHGLEETAAELAQDPEVRAVVAEFDSPGGAVLGIDGAAGALAELAKVRPVHGLVHPLCASAAYWLASQITDLTVTPGSELGSIGIMTMTESSEKPGSDGLKLHEFRSSHAVGKNPDGGDDESAALIQARLDEAEARFHAAISAGRDIPADQLLDRLSADDDPRHGGIVYNAASAVQRGLADRIETRAAFYSRIMGAYAPKPAQRVARAQGRSAQVAAALARART